MPKAPNPSLPRLIKGSLETLDLPAQRDGINQALYSKPAQRLNYLLE